MQPKHLHFIGICGVAMSALGLAFKKKGYKVTGSDAGFFPPVSTHLKDAGIDFYPGWHPDKMVAGGVPDLVIVGNVASSTNPEWQYVQEHKLKYKSYPELVAEHLIKQNSIVVAGTYGKTTSSALVIWILKQAGYDPSYLFGGLSMNELSPHASPSAAQAPATPPTPPLVRGGGEPLPSADITNSAWSVMEGDEYKSARWDDQPKFAHYRPTHLLLTSVVWDHADVYPSEQLYIAAFKKLVGLVPEGLKIISEKALPVIKDNGLSKVIAYGKNSDNDYIYSAVAQTTDGVSFTIKHRGQTWLLSTPALGEYMADNATGCFALTHQLGIAPEIIIKAIGSFKSVRRRLEKRLETPVTVFDDIAHSPSKARAVLESLRQIYARPHPTLSSADERDDAPPSFAKEGAGGRSRIFAIFEPNGGNRRPEAAPGYDNAFADADEVLIPHLTKIKYDPSELEPPFEGDEIARIIGATHPNARYIPDDGGLITTLKQKTKPGDVVVFLGSHGFRGMIEKLCANYEKNTNIRT